ncbi:MAG TPA: lactate utilization protein [Syntrophales bacterium]|nr:lactate utilization protein [Syntrophales bacterium]HOL58547.1 lactate utilization protein [Syntrophales bacterium]HPO34845.1 lactate utilization protein [Syntrophales bacterium]
MDAREEILGRLRRVPAPTLEPRPQLPPLPELALSREALLERLMDELTKLEAVPHRVASMGEAKEKLGEILTGEGITKVIISTDEVVSAFDLIAWGKERGISVYLPSHFPDREAFKRAVFEEVEAGITGADFAVAESGTLGIIHDRHQPRLISLAPLVHIALLPTSRVVPVYESAISAVFKRGKEIPSQFTFITGPSMTADIKATPFKGMHGPRRLYVIIYDAQEGEK